MYCIIRIIESMFVARIRCSCTRVLEQCGRMVGRMHVMIVVVPFVVAAIGAWNTFLYVLDRLIVITQFLLI